MKGLRCWIIGELLGQHIENQLSEKESKIVLNHIQACNRCKSELQETKRLKEILIPVSDLLQRPDAFWEEIENNIMREISDEKQSTRSIGTIIPKFFQDILYDFRRQPALNATIVLYSLLCSVAQFLL